MHEGTVREQQSGFSMVSAAQPIFLKDYAILNDLQGAVECEKVRFCKILVRAVECENVIL